ncbi:MAG: hypothetical protein M1575_00085 [Patescibacteria group bacterium]|nr:hypothetical protein [Patescibacteria group bacterium]MCL5095124.1 hypothetical protein [Patescibacteria group bacterium]
MNKLAKLTKTILVLNVILLLLQVFVANRLTTAGLTLSQTENETMILRDENEFLERKIASFSSLVSVSQKAAEAGYTKPKLYYLVSEVPVALENLNVAAK